MGAVAWRFGLLGLLAAAVLVAWALRDGGAPARAIADRAPPEEEPPARPPRPPGAASPEAPRDTRPAEILDLEPAGVLAGTVVDPDGRPVPGLALLARAGGGEGGVVRARSLDTRRLLAGGIPFAEGRTNALGAFTLADLPAGTYGLLSRDEAWVLEHEDGLAPPRRDVRVVAQPAFSLVGQVVDEATGAPVPEVRVQMLVRGPSHTFSLGARCTGEDLFVVWKPSAYHREGCTAAVTLEAEGYAEYRTKLEYGPDARTHALRVALARAVPPRRGTVVVEVVRTSGGPAEFPLEFRLLATDDPDRRPVRVEPAPLGKGRYRIEGPAGRWSLRVEPEFGAMVGRTVEVDIREDAEVPLRVQLPPLAVIRVRIQGFGDDDPGLQVAFPDGTSALGTSACSDGRDVVLPPGAWIVEVDGASDPRQTIEVRDGQDADLAFAK